MTPRQRGLLAQLHHDVFYLERQLKRTNRRLIELEGSWPDADQTGVNEYTDDEIEGLLRFNQRLSVLEHYLLDLGQTQNTLMMARVTDPNDPLDDYEIEATLYFILREEDCDFDDDDDNFLTIRRISLKHSFEMIGDGQDHKCPIHQFPGELQTTRHCRLFFELYNHSYGVEQQELSLRDCLRIGQIWVDVAVQHQSTLNIDTGRWELPIAD